jgi:hypothetical protein
MTRFYSLIITSIIIIVAPFSCKHKKTTSNANEFHKSAQIQNEIKNSFSRTFPDPMKPYEESPNIGAIGELITTSPHFLMDGVPQSNFSLLKSWAQPLIASLDIESMTFSYFEDSPEQKEKNIFPSMGIIKYNSDGTIEKQTGISHELALPKASFKGKPIQTKAWKAQ